MPQATADDGTPIHYQDKGPTKGPGETILFLHEYGGDPRSWEPQVAAFARTHRCLVPATRGYLPSGIPDDADAYSYEIVAEDARAVLDDAGVERAHVVGLSMGAYTGLMLALRHPGRAAAEHPHAGESRRGS